MNPRKKFFSQIGALALLYFVLARLGLSVSAVGGFASLVWPPAGVSVAVLMIAGIRFWPGIFIGAMLANLTVGANLFAAVGIGLGNTAEAIVAVVLLNRAGFRYTLHRLKDVFSLAAFGSGVSSFVSATIGVFCLWGTQAIATNAVGETWRAWWLGDAIGILVLTPFLLFWTHRYKIDFRTKSLFRWAELGVTLVGGVLLVLTIFSFLPFASSIRFYLLFPWIIWVAFRFNQQSLVTGLGFVVVIAILATHQGFGPFADVSISDRLMSVQIFLGVAALTGMALGAIFSEFKFAQAQSQEREEKYRSTAEAASDTIITIDQNNKILFVNQIAHKVFGYRAEEMIGHSLLMIIPERLRAGHEMGVRRYLSSGKKTISWSGVEIMARRKDGSEFPVEISFGEYRTDEGRAFTGVVRDISERKRIEAELIQAKEQAVVASQTKSAFLANMSHEIRTPLGAVLGFSELIANEDLSSEERAKYVESVRRNGILLENIINDILDLSKVEAGKIGIDLKRTAWSEILNDLSHLLKEKAESKGLEFETIFQGLPPAAITTDALRLRQILLNVVGNAIKFTDSGYVRVSMSLEAVHEKLGLRFDVEDTGPGISLEHAAKLFDPFHQGDNSATRKHGGTGLGLALSRNLARALGGDLVLAESGPGMGCHFVLRVDPGQVFWEAAPVPSGDSKKYLGGLKGMKLILVEDSKDNQLLVKHLLEKAGAKVQVADNGFEALEKVAKEDFDVILMDLQMPVMDGYRATAELREAGYKKPIVALTAHALKEEREQCLKSGFDEHICKPVDRQNLIRVLSRFSDAPDQLGAPLDL